MTRKPNIQNIVTRSDEFQRIREVMVKQIPRVALNFTTLEERIKERTKNEDE